MGETLNFNFKSSGDISNEITVDRMNAILKAVRRSQPPDRVKGGRLTIGESGWLLSIDPGTIAAAGNYPLKPVQTAPTKVRFVYGTVHGLVPTIAAVEIDPKLADPANPELTCSATGVIYCKVDLAADTYEAENPILEFVAGSAADVPADVDRVSAHVVLVGVTVEEGQITAIAPVHQGSIDVASCGGVSNYWDLG